MGTRSNPVNNVNWGPFLEEYDWLLREAFPLDLDWRFCPNSASHPLRRKASNLARRIFGYSKSYCQTGDLAWKIFRVYKKWRMEYDR